MSRKRFSAEEAIAKLREAEVLLSKGETVEQACRQIAVHPHTYYRWRREYNHFRPHSSLGYRPPAPEAVLPMAVSL